MVSSMKHPTSLIVQTMCGDIPVYAQKGLELLEIHSQTRRKIHFILLSTHIAGVRTRDLYRHTELERTGCMSPLGFYHL
jgi:hypothetical protein